MILRSSHVLGALAASTFIACAHAKSLAAMDALPQQDEIRATVAEMLTDSQARSSLLQTSAFSGHDGSFFLASPDGDFRLKISGQIQLRYGLVVRDNDTDMTIDDFESGFQTRRTKLNFAGNVFGSDIFFAIQGEFVRGGGGFRLDEDAYVGYRFGNGVVGRVGMFKLPFLRERIVSSKRQLAVERSFTDQIFSQGDDSQGVEISRRTDRWRLTAALSDGLATGNTDFTSNLVIAGSPALVRGGEADYAITVRVEHLVTGEWGQFGDFTSPRGSALAVLVGVAAHWQDGADSPISSDVELLTWTADVSVEGDGWNIFVAYIGRALGVDNPSSIPGASNFNSTDHGFVVQGGHYLTERLESFVRYDVIIPDRGVGGASAFNTITCGFNYYIHGHSAKLTLDAQWFLDASANTALVAGNTTGIGFLNNGSEENEFSVRLQFQLLF